MLSLMLMYISSPLSANSDNKELREQAHFFAVQNLLFLVYFNSIKLRLNDVIFWNIMDI